jgi:MoaA/NifB/PqqE/SkfB family radical SAM enzyme
LDFLWVSLDGATPESYLDVRLGDELPRIIENLKALRLLRYRLGSRTPKLGIAFVAMKRNLQDLPEVVSLGRRLGARKFHVSNLLPYTEEMRGEVLYDRSLWEDRYRFERLVLPRMDSSVELLAAWEKLTFRSDWTALVEREQGGAFDTCPFVARGSVSVRWDGKVSPCLPLLHAHESYLDETHRRNEAYFVGSLEESSLRGIWEDSGYVRLRERLQEFDFSPCTVCNSCEMAEGNVEDCFGSELPACGGCLWAQGFIRCP